MTYFAIQIWPKLSFINKECFWLRYSINSPCLLQQSKWIPPSTTEKYYDFQWHFVTEAITDQSLKKKAALTLPLLSFQSSSLRRRGLIRWSVSLAWLRGRPVNVATGSYKCPADFTLQATWCWGIGKMGSSVRSSDEIWIHCVWEWQIAHGCSRQME